MKESAQLTRWTQVLLIIYFTINIIISLIHFVYADDHNFDLSSSNYRGKPTGNACKSIQEPSIEKDSPEIEKIQTNAMKFDRQSNEGSICLRLVVHFQCRLHWNLLTLVSIVFLTFWLLM